VGLNCSEIQVVEGLSGGCEAAPQGLDAAIARFGAALGRDKFSYRRLDVGEGGTDGYVVAEIKPRRPSKKPVGLSKKEPRLLRL
jgi:hypothetical protein